MFLNQLWTSGLVLIVSQLTVRPLGDSELVEHELFNEENHQTVEAPRIVLTTAKAKVTTSPSRLGYGSMYESNPGFIIIAFFACSTIRMRAFV